MLIKKYNLGLPLYAYMEANKDYRIAEMHNDEVFFRNLIKPSDFNFVEPLNC